MGPERFIEGYAREGGGGVNNWCFLFFKRVMPYVYTGSGFGSGFGGSFFVTGGDGDGVESSSDNE